MSTCKDETEIAYESRMRADIATILADVTASGAPIDLSAFFARLPGYWPPDVLSQLDSAAIGNDPAIRARAAEIAAKLRTGPVSDPDQGDPTRIMLPVPHPLDADWRFTAAAREHLLESASACASGACVLLGTPSLFAHACDQLDLREVVLVDHSQATVAAARSFARHHALLSVVRADLTVAGHSHGHGFGIGPASVVVADPPWYRREQVGFLRAASVALGRGGVLLLAAPPAGTRSVASHDRVRLLEDADAQGLRLVEEVPGALSYTSSPFERAAVAASGAGGTPTDWRRGDLLVFRRDSSSVVARALDAVSTEPHWTETAVGRVRVRVGGVHAPIANGRPPTVRPGVPGGVSLSVSRRSSDRSAGDIWTTGNGVWRAEGDGAPHAITAALRQETRDVQGVDALFDAIALEALQLRAWGWG